MALFLMLTKEVDLTPFAGTTTSRLLALALSGTTPPARVCAATTVSISESEMARGIVGAGCLADGKDLPVNYLSTLIRVCATAAA